MTVAELIKKLQAQNPEREVVIAFPSGDYWRTVVATEARGVERQPVVASKYHGAGVWKLLPDDEDKASRMLENAQDCNCNEVLDAVVLR